jgi:uncharacterized membrane protein YeiH
MKKLFLLFAMLCTLLSAWATDSNYKLRVWYSGNIGISGYTIADGGTDISFQTTDNPNIYVFSGSITVGSGGGSFGIRLLDNGSEKYYFRGCTCIANTWGVLTAQ